MRGGRLRKVRIAVSLAAFVVVTLSFLFPAAVGAVWFTRACAWLWLPAAATFTVTVCVGWLVVSLLFGRVYCSSVCPLGTIMDAAARLRRRGGGRFSSRACYHYSTPRSILRNTVVVVTFAVLLAGLTVCATVLDPFCAYSRMCDTLVEPLIRGGWKYGMLAGAAIALVTLAAVVTLAVRRGRLWCNTLCPVGTTMGYVSRHAFLRIDIDTDKCIHCRQCEWVCKAECIDLTSCVVDGSRCVNCFNCVDVCPNDAIHYTFSRKQLSIPMIQRTGARPVATLEKP